MFDLKALDKKTVVQFYVKSPALECAADCLGTARYQSDRLIIRTKEAYIDIVIDQLELLRPEIVIHRISGDPKLDDLVEPHWLVKKFCVLNDIDKEMVKRDTYQGKALEKTSKEL